MTDSKLLVDVLRAAGHTDAANLAEKLSAATGPPATTEAPEEATRKFISEAEAERHAEGSFMLKAMQRDLPDRFFNRR